MQNLRYLKKWLFATILMVAAIVFCQKNQQHIENTVRADPERDPKAIKITVLYDNFIHLQGTRADWGFACLIEGTEETILFDTGSKPEILEHNARQMNVDLKKVQKIVLSHIHGDHTGGLSYILDVNPNVTVYIPQSFPGDFSQNIEKKNAKVVRVEKSLNICDSVYSTGELGTQIKEQALIIETDKGISIVTGCAHPGILEIIQKAKELLPGDICLVCGGFHLNRFSEEQNREIVNEFKSLGVQKCGATHCTGDKAISLFREAYGDQFVEMGTGRIIYLD